MTRPLPSHLVKTSTPEQLELLAEWIVTRQDVAAAFGVAPQTVDNWRFKGKKGWTLQPRTDIDAFPRYHWSQLLEFAEKTGIRQPNPAILPPGVARAWHLIE